MPHAPAQPRQLFPRWCKWVAVILLLIVALGYFVVRPAADRLLQGAGGLVAVLAAHAAETLGQTHALACQSTTDDPLVRQLLEGEVTCAPVEEVQWHQPRDAETLEFEFTLTSDSGKHALAHIVAKMHPDGPHLDSIVVTGDAGSVMLLPLP